MREFMDLPVIDAHAHIYDFNDFDTLLDIKKRHRLSAYNVLSIPAFQDEFLTQNLLAALFKAMHPDDVYAFGSLDYTPLGTPKDKIDMAGQAKRLMEIGFDGIKMLEGKPMIYKLVGGPLDSPVYDEFYAYLESERIPVLAHFNDPIKCWREPMKYWDRIRIRECVDNPWLFYGDGSYPAKEGIYSQVDCILEKFPRLRIIFAHFFYLSAEPERAAAFMDKWPEVSFDITPGMEMLPNFAKRTSEWHDFFVKYQDRIIFGTDDAYSQMDRFIFALRSFLETDGKFQFAHTKGEWSYDCEGIKLGREALEKIYAGNFQRYAGKAPRELNFKLLLEETRRIREKVMKGSVNEAILAQVSEIEDKFMTFQAN